ncbi:MAG: hemerythrin family protein [Elusimicrobiaceae bacterium]|nr:hemerythrin family protein [Elusimicrobiaceae bacterium]
MPLEWTPALATGNDAIDAQHKELFDRANAFAKTIAGGGEQPDAESIIAFMDDYARLHFADEEKLLEAHAYPEMAVHKAQHAYFMRNLANIERTYAAQGASEELTELLYRHITSWLLAHIQKSDGAWAVWLRGR